MANKKRTVRENFKIVPTPENKGLSMTIDIKLYDNGLANINGIPMGVPYNPMLTASRLISQALEELQHASNKRNAVLN